MTTLSLPGMRFIFLQRYIHHRPFLPQASSEFRHG